MSWRAPESPWGSQAGRARGRVQQPTELAPGGEAPWWGGLAGHPCHCGRTGFGSGMQVLISMCSHAAQRLQTLVSALGRGGGRQACSGAYAALSSAQ